jgi:ABC-type lipoprotein release transport system permease subunit
LLLALGALSGIIVAMLVNRLGTMTAAIVGVAFGLAMYAVDMVGFARAFPSLLDLRDWMSVLAYGIQGAVTAGLYKALTRDDVETVTESTGRDLRDLRDVRLV